MLPFDLSMNNMRLDLLNSEIIKKYVAVSQNGAEIKGGQDSITAINSYNTANKAINSNNKVTGSNGEITDNNNKVTGTNSRVTNNPSKVSATNSKGSGTVSGISDINGNILGGNVNGQVPSNGEKRAETWASMWLEDLQQQRGSFYNTSSIIFIVWIFGALIMMIYNIFMYIMMKKKLKKSSQVMQDVEVRSQLRSIRKTLGVNKIIDFRSTHMVDSPLVMGCRKPVLYLTYDDYSEEELYYILAHELTHVKKHHATIKFLFAMINSLYWFNPFVYLMTREMSKDMEILCDEGVSKVIGAEKRKSYCEVILKCVTMKSGQNLLFSSSFGGKKNQVKERLTHIMNIKKKNRGIALASFIFIAMIGVTLLVSFGGKNAVTSDNNTLGAGEKINKDLELLQKRVDNVMSLAVVPGAKESTREEGEKFISSIPFKEDYDFKIYESSKNSQGTSEPVRYAIGICNKKQSPIMDLQMAYNFKDGSNNDKIENIVFQKYEDYSPKGVYLLKNMDNCVSLDNGKIIVSVNSDSNKQIAEAMENFKFGEEGLAYLEDVVKRNAQLSTLENKDFIETKVWKGNRKKTEYVALKGEEKNKAMSSEKNVSDSDNNILKNAIEKGIRVVIDGKDIKVNQWALDTAKARCGYETFSMDDIKDIKQAKLVRYNEYWSSTKVEIDEKEQILSDSEEISKIVASLKKGTLNTQPSNYIPYITMCDVVLNLSKADGSMINIPIVDYDVENNFFLGDNFYGLNNKSSEQIMSCFNEIGQSIYKLANVNINEKVVDKNSTFYLGMPRQDAEKLMFKQGIYNPNTTAITSYPSDMKWGDVQCHIENMGLTFTTKDAKESLYSIDVSDPSIVSNAGLKVGDSKATMEKLYGTNYNSEKIISGNGDGEIQRCVYEFKENTFSVNIKQDKVESWSIDKDIYKHKRENRPIYMDQWEATSIVKNNSGVTMEKLNNAKTSSGNNLFFLENTLSVYDKSYSKLIYSGYGVKYEEKTLSASQFEKDNNISLKSLGITSQEIIWVKPNYLNNETPMTIIMGKDSVDSNGADKALLLMNGDCIELSRIRYN